jgi:hypothetical protein
MCFLMMFALHANNIQLLNCKAVLLLLLVIHDKSMQWHRAVLLQVGGPPCYTALGYHAAAMQGSLLLLLPVHDNVTPLLLALHGKSMRQPCI